MLQVLQPILNDIKEDLASVKSDLSRLNKSVNMKLDSLDTTDTRMSDDLRCVKTDLSSLIESVVKQGRQLKKHKKEMITELMNLNEALDSVSALIHDEFSFPEENMTSAELANLDEHLQEKCECPPIHTCGGTGGWRRVVNLDMTDNCNECPEGWSMTDYSKRTCGRASEGDRSCDSVTYPVCGGEYSQVCGRIKAYQWGWTAAFYGPRNIDLAYFSGVAVMHGSPRQHIWTFAAGAAENWNNLNTFFCPCDKNYNYHYTSVPSFVGEDYFCESGITYPQSRYTFHSNDTLWDGKDCHSSSTCCSLHDPPFFTKTLSTPTTDDLELRMCLYDSIRHMNIAVELIELYVK